ncbi:hypothetical protein SaccyDRAFT_0538 [Saccharomonospora cyanea NA-134]|uniref:Uncharacterized protein n=1 Tax=Saccharomonospora cyanea NA-134 TaxID=882082 RepID=H5XGE7_9PSEU|nr:hypothetical protein SaccyDRAFT_0538 [Saccharomonospora cyanea NA-134]
MAPTAFSPRKMVGAGIVTVFSGLNTVGWLVRTRACIVESLGCSGRFALLAMTEVDG